MAASSDRRRAGSCRSAADSSSTVRSVRAPGLPQSLDGGPDLTRLVPAFVVLGLPSEPREAAARIGVPLVQFASVADEGLQAEIDVPPGLWRLWPARGVAIWVGARPASLPRIAFSCAEVDFARALVLLADDGLWPSELRVLTEKGWSPSLRVGTALRVLVAASADALYGLWSDEAGRALRATIFRTGEVRAETRELAERLSIVLGGFSYA